jgi:hypothetical protein
MKVHVLAGKSAAPSPHTKASHGVGVGVVVSVGNGVGVDVVPPQGTNL